MRHSPEGSPEASLKAPRLENYAQGVERYIQRTASESVLRPHQLEVFADFQTFFANGLRRGYVELPTGTGKTVLFIELTKALLDVPEGVRKPKILVVTPTKDLVHQTLGRSGKKGYGRFASELRVGSFFSDSSPGEKRRAGWDDATITTYRSLSIIEKTPQLIPIKDLGAEALAAIY